MKFMSFSNHCFHLVNYSPWPLLGSVSVFIFLTGLIKMFHLNQNNYILLIGTLMILLIMFQWWRDVIRESTFQGNHTNQVLKGMKFGMILFIISEIFFFISFFWMFFHSSLNFTIEVGLNWPPSGINSFDPFKIPLLNTIILLTSGISITWSHHSLLIKNYNQMFNSLLLTVILGVYFSMLQLFEYIESSFTISDSCYGSGFFLMTGFHGIHVLIGTLFLMVCLIRHFNQHFSSIHHFGFEAAAWYWHFVDLVWLFLYITIYWWGS